ncbi:MAG: STAS domain-containing protein [Verrucomicrobiota bacterium]
MNWLESSEDGMHLIALHGDIDLQHSPSLRKLLQAKAAAQIPVLVLDFTGVKYIDSSGLATLVEYYQKSRSYSGKIALAGLSNRVRSVFDLVRLSEIFSIYPTVAEAKEGLKVSV